MNWQAVRNITHSDIGRFLVLMLVVWSPFKGGPRLPSFLLALMGVWLLWKKRPELLSSTAFRRWVLVFALLWVPMVLSVPFSLEWQRSAGISAVLLLYLLAGIAVVYALLPEKNRLWLIKWISIALIVWIVDGIIQYTVGRDLLGIPLTQDGRVVGFFADNLRLPLFLAVLLPLLLWQSLRSGWIGSAGLYLSSVLLIMMGGARNGLVMVALTTLGIYKRISFRYKLPVLTALLVAVAFLTTLSPVLQERFSRIRMTGGVTFESVDLLLSNRLYIWETAGRMLLDRPLAGIGVGAFASAYDSYSVRPGDMFRHGSAVDQGTGVYHAHQMYVSVAAETGFIGLSGIIAIYVLCARWYLRAGRERRELAWPFVFSLFVATFPLNSQPILLTHWWFPILLLLMCASLAALENDTMGEDNPDAHAARAVA